MAPGSFGDAAPLAVRGAEREITAEAAPARRLLYRAGMSATPLPPSSGHDPFARAGAQVSAALLEEHWTRLDRELSRVLARRAQRRAAREEGPSPLDAVAHCLRRLRAAVGAVTAASAPLVAARYRAGDRAHAHLVARTYRWSLRVARELEAIEERATSAEAAWERFRSFAPFALASLRASVTVHLDGFGGGELGATVDALRRAVAGAPEAFGGATELTALAA